jgi:hypothetical protein
LKNTARTVEITPGMAYNWKTTERGQILVNEGRKHLPPYVSYRTFRNFIDRLQQRLPSRIDRSYWGEILSGSSGTQLMAALRFLGLIDANGKPLERLKSLVAARGETRNKLMREMASDAFGFVLNGHLDLESATYAQLQEVFHNTFQVTEDVSRKCVKFFIALTGDAGVPISPFITRRTRTISGMKTPGRKPSKRTNQNGIVPQVTEEIPVQSSWHTMLLEKFPSFDPSWSDEIKEKWFNAFDELLKKDPAGP